MSAMEHRTPNNGQEPLILCLETATPVSSIGICRGNQMLGLMEYEAGNLHSKLITVMIGQLMENLELEMDQLDAVSVASGPGSYTGLRVGVSVAKGICFALDIPLIAISSLYSLAWQVTDIASSLDAYICPMIDARRMEVYCCLFNGKMESILETDAVIIEENTFSGELVEKKIIFVGSGAEKCKSVLSKFPNAVFLDKVLSSASSMILPSYNKYCNKDFENLDQFEPYYLKDFVATESKKKYL